MKEINYSIEIDYETFLLLCMYLNHCKTKPEMVIIRKDIKKSKIEDYLQIFLNNS